MVDRTTFVPVNDGDELSEGWFNGAVNAAGMLGEVRMFALSIANSVTKATLQTAGWAICDGTTPATQGISSPTITTTPDLQDKFIMGSDNETSGTTGGESTHTLITGEMPSHTHQQQVSNADGSNNYGRRGNSNDAQFQTGSAGSGDAHENKPPFYELVYFLKVKL